MRRGTASVRLALCLGLLGLAAAPSRVAGEAAAAGRLEITRGEFVGRVLLTGELVAEDAVVMVVPNARIWPVTVRWLEEDGAEVAAGDVIVEFDNSQLVNNLEGLEHAAIEAANQLSSLQATVRGEEIEAELAYERRKAELEKARLDASVPARLLSEQEYEERRLAHERAQIGFDEAVTALELKRTSSRARIEKQRVALAKAQRAAARAREGIELLTLEAPRAGILLVSENDDEGRPFQSGDTTWPGRAIARLPELSSMIVEARLFDVDDGRIEAGMPVTAVVDAFPDVALAGEIVEVDDIANQTNRRSLRRVFRVRIRLDGLDIERMRPGMSVKAVVEDRRPEVLLVPRAALGWVEEGAGGAVVAALSGGELRPIEIGPCNRRLCVLEDGLSRGDRLIAYRAAARSGEAEAAP